MTARRTYATGKRTPTGEPYRATRRAPAAPRKVEQEQTCEWFLLCTNTATGTLPHPILGEVPVCDRCRAKYDALS